MRKTRRSLLPTGRATMDAPPFATGTRPKSADGVGVGINHLTGKLELQERQPPERSWSDPVEIFDDVQNPTDKINLVEFQVPGRSICMIRAIAVTYSDPLYTASDVVGWCVTIDGAIVPYIRHASKTFFYTSFGDLARPMEIEPLLVRSGQTVAIEIRPIAGFNEHLTMCGRLSGRLQDE